MPSILLYQFTFSHFNEKARWALDYKGIDHRRKSLLPGPHAPYMLAVSGQTQTPVINAGGRIIIGSARIIDFLEEHFPKPPLYPQDPHRRQDALDLQAWLDQHLGPAVRRALFADLLTDPLYVTQLFSAGNPFNRLAYMGSYPLIAGFLAGSEGITPNQAEADRELIAQVLEFITVNAGPSGYLVGDCFSVADLAAAALLMPAVMPVEARIPALEPKSRTAKKWLARWEDHPGTAWVALMNQRHRNPGGQEWSTQRSPRDTRE